MPCRGGTVCIYRSCPSKTSDKTVSMFRIPRDSKRAHQWLKSAIRSDLLFKTSEELVKNYRLCELHFEPKWFTSQPTDVRKRLLNEAVPTVFEHSNPKKLQDTLNNELPKKVIILPDTKVIPVFDLPAVEDTICFNASGTNDEKYQLHSGIPGPSGTMSSVIQPTEIEFVTPD